MIDYGRLSQLYSYPDPYLAGVFFIHEVCIPPAAYLLGKNEAKENDGADGDRPG